MNCPVTLEGAGWKSIVLWQLQDCLQEAHMAIPNVREGSIFVNSDHGFDCRRCFHRFLHVVSGAPWCHRHYSMLYWCLPNRVTFVVTVFDLFSSSNSCIAGICSALWGIHILVIKTVRPDDWQWVLLALLSSRRSLTCRTLPSFFRMMKVGESHLLKPVSNSTPVCT